MPDFVVPCRWQYAAKIHVRAKNAKEAIRRVRDRAEDESPSGWDEGHFQRDSFRIDEQGVYPAGTRAFADWEKDALAAGVPEAILDDIALTQDQPINPKVVKLVGVLSRAGYRTIMSGDLYGDQLVYVDLEPEAAWIAAQAELPPGWLLSSAFAVLTRRDVLGEPVPAAQREMAEALEAEWLPIRLARAGGAVSDTEAKTVVAALNAARDRAKRKRK